MAIIFECVACGKLSVVAATPPLCVHCGCGNGTTVEIGPEDILGRPDATKSKNDLAPVKQK
jgi:hypothetical protein